MTEVTSGVSYSMGSSGMLALVPPQPSPPLLLELSVLLRRPQEALPQGQGIAKDTSLSALPLGASLSWDLIDTAVTAAALEPSGCQTSLASITGTG